MPASNRLPPADAASSAPELLTLHALRLTGWPSTEAVAAWAGLDRAVALELLEDDEARGFVSRPTYAGRSGWSLTDRGRAEDERRLADELARTGTSEAVERAHSRFLPLNERFLQACTRWQIRPQAHDSLAVNDHTDWRWDADVVDELGRIEVRLADVWAELAALHRFDRYLGRFAAARCCRALVLRTTASLMLRPLSDKLRRHVDVLIGAMPGGRRQRRPGRTDLRRLLREVLPRRFRSSAP